jgi:hypothetical protein
MLQLAGFRSTSNLDKSRDIGYRAGLNSFRGASQRVQWIAYKS